MNEEIINQAVLIAQQKAQSREWKKGDTACHPNEPKTLEIRGFGDNGLVTIGLENIEWIVPRVEIFDPNDARTIALNLKFEMPPLNKGCSVEI